MVRTGLASFDPVVLVACVYFFSCDCVVGSLTVFFAAGLNAGSEQKEEIAKEEKKEERREER